MSAHTPGPWVWAAEDGDWNNTAMPVLHGPNNERICDFGDCEKYYPREGTPPNEADARLIAAAPELLAELISAMEELEWVYGTDTESIMRYRTAIAKATGAA